jgi:hypothetical protein
MNSPYPPSSSVDYPASSASNMNAWGPTQRERVQLPAGPYPTAKKEFGSEYFYSPRQKLSKTAMIVLGIILLIVLILIFHTLRKRSSPAFYYF